MNSLIRYFVTFIFITIFIGLKAQGLMSIEELSNLDRDSLITLAKEKIDQPFSTDLFDRIEIQYSKEDVDISFKMSICYIPSNSQYYYGVNVYLIQDIVTYTAFANPQDFHSDNCTFFIPGTESEKSIKFIVHALDKLGDIEFTHKGQLYDTETMVIRNNPNYYDIEIISESWDYSCKIDKNTQEVYNIVNGFMEPPIEE